MYAYEISKTFTSICCNRTQKSCIMPFLTNLCRLLNFAKIGLKSVLLLPLKKRKCYYFS